MPFGSVNAGTMGTLGIWSSELRGGDPAQVGAVAAELDNQGWGSLWIPGTTGRGVWDDTETLLASAPHLAVAQGVIGIWNPDAADAAANHHRLAAAYGPRVVTGFGVSNPQSAKAAGREFGTPLSAMNRFLDQLDTSPLTIAAEDRIIGGLGPKMVALSGKRAAGVHPFLVTPESNAANRSLIGPKGFLAPYQAVVLESDPGQARTIARNGIGMFLRFPSYQANLRRLGFGDEDLIPGGSNRLIDATVAWGSIDTIAERLREHWAAGADHIALHVLSNHGGFPIDEWRELGHLLEIAPHSTEA
jgi:probable F420-dependent oxidoreductase